MITSIAALAIFMAVIITPGMVAQSLEERRAKADADAAKGEE